MGWQAGGTLWARAALGGRERLRPGRSCVEGDELTEGEGGGEGEDDWELAESIVVRSGQLRSPNADRGEALRLRSQLVGAVRALADEL